MAIKLWQVLVLMAAVGVAAGFFVGSHQSAQTATVVDTVTSVVTVNHVEYKMLPARTVSTAARIHLAPKHTASPPVAKPTDKDFAVQDLQVKDDGVGNIGGIVRVTNTGSVQRTAVFEITFFQSGRIVGTAQGVANAVAAGQTVTVDLVSQDSMVSGTFRYAFQVSAEY